MDSENVSLTETSGERTSLPAAYVSAVSVIGDSSEASARIIVERDTGTVLSSFTVAYRFSAVGKGGSITESRFFSLVYEREGLNTKESISIRVRIPEGYRAVGCTAYISTIKYPDGTAESFSFGDDGTIAQSCIEEGFASADPSGEGRRIPKKVKTAVISLASVIGAVIIICGGIGFARYSGIKGELNSLINEGRYGEAYKISREYSSPVLERTICGNIIKKCLNDRDYKTAYVYGVVSGKEKDVFKRVEYEIGNMETPIFQTDAFAVLCKLDNDDEFDETVKNYIRRATESGDYYSAVSAAAAIRNVQERNLRRRNLIVEGTCGYAGDKTAGKEKFERATRFFSSHMTDDETTNKSIALEIISKCIAEDDAAGAVVLSAYFGELFGSFDVTPSSVAVTADNASIARSADYAYQMLTDEQKRAYHANTLALSEEMFSIVGGSIAKLGVYDAVSVATYENRTAVLHKNGTVTHVPNNGHNTVSNVPSGLNAVQIAVGLEHTVILMSDGTVTALGGNSFGQCDVDGWSDIVEIAAGRYFTLGLRSDGTVVACGSNRCGQCDVSDFNNVISIEACDQSSVVLFSDGTVDVRGSRVFGLGDAKNFTKAEQIKAGGCAIVARLADGKFSIADGGAGSSSGDVSGWSDERVKAFAVGSQCTAYEDKNGRIVTSGDGAPK